LILNDLGVMPNNDDKKELLKLANRIKALRKERNLTQEDCFNDTGIHFARIEQGKRNISYLTLISICKYFDITPNSFLKF